MFIHEFEDFTLEVVQNCEDAAMRLTIDNAGGFSIILPKNGAFYYSQIADSGVNLVHFKSSSSLKKEPDLSFHLSNRCLEKLKEISLLPILKQREIVVSTM